MKFVTTEIEILVLLILVVLAIIAAFFQRKRRAKRRARLEKDLELQKLARSKGKTQERKEHKPKAEVVKNYGSHVPEDSMLRRHYITHLRSLIISLTGPRPTDSTLSRHYDTHIASVLERALEDPSYAQRVVMQHEEQHRKSFEKEILHPSSIDVQLKEEFAIEEKTVKTAVLKKRTIGSHIPEDSALRRHYIHHLRTMIETQISSADSNYATMIENELDQCLQDEDHVNQLIEHYEKKNATKNVQ